MHWYQISQWFATEERFRIGIDQHQFWGRVAVIGGVPLVWVSYAHEKCRWTIWFWFRRVSVVKYDRFVHVFSFFCRYRLWIRNQCNRVAMFSCISLAVWQLANPSAQDGMVINSTTGCRWLPNDGRIPISWIGWPCPHFETNLDEGLGILLVDCPFFGLIFQTCLIWLAGAVYVGNGVSWSNP